MFVAPRKVENGAAEDQAGEGVRKRHFFDCFDTKVAGGERRRKCRGEAAYAPDRLRIGVHAEDFITFPEQVDEVASRAAARVENSHARRYASPKELVKEVDIDLAELLA